MPRADHRLASLDFLVPGLADERRPGAEAGFVEGSGDGATQAGAIYAGRQERFDLFQSATAAGQHCSQPSLRRTGVETTVRPSFWIYNTRDEIDRLVAAVKRIARQ